ncbi:hypothetical protein NA56DRAFT_204015 [Hyaloscypha hepaticicola]|uniref:Uncharacterized protein n=1 Tax=Hyaloscypha hepaticicola TaxID=2082293 RepID=A0A2J6PZS1_9HELO|nr:hypothetical protein NA56DRAFT_204015 [Hyaloscypha hepaticicola]
METMCSERPVHWNLSAITRAICKPSRVGSSIFSNQDSGLSHDGTVTWWRDTPRMRRDQRRENVHDTVALHPAMPHHDFSYQGVLSSTSNVTSLAPRGRLPSRGGSEQRRKNRLLLGILLSRLDKMRNFIRPERNRASFSHATSCQHCSCTLESCGPIRRTRACPGFNLHPGCKRSREGVACSLG